MIEWLLSGLARLITWAWSSALMLYYIGTFLIVVGGLVVFTVSIIQHYWKRSHEDGPATAIPEQPRVTVHVNNLNLTLEVTEPQLRRLLDGQDLEALPAADPDEMD